MDDLRLVPSAPLATSVTSGAGPATSSAYGVHDTLRYGFTSARSQTAPEHPVKVIQDNYDAQQDRLHFALQRVAFGSHMPIRQQMERHIVSQTGRLPALQSSRLGLDVLSGKDETIEFEDYLNDPVYSVGKFDPHTTMERKLKLNV